MNQKKKIRQQNVVNRLKEKMKSFNRELFVFFEDNPNRPDDDTQERRRYDNVVYTIQLDRRMTKQEIVKLSRKFGEPVPADLDCIGLSAWSSTMVITP